MRIHDFLIGALSMAALAAPQAALAAEAGILVGDSINGEKLYGKHCAACHGPDARGGRTGVALTDAGRMNLIRDDQMFDMIKSGQGLKDSKQHSFKNDLPYLETWDVVAHVRTKHMTLAQFFPEAGRYISKVYEIDKFGLGRIEAAVGKALKDKSAAVFTLFDFEGEEGNLTYVPQDPIKLDQLRKDQKAGYLVFLPFTHEGYDGEIGVGMDSGGRITKLLVHESKKGADLLNKSLSRFEGMGKKGQKEPFKVAGGKPMTDLADSVFPIYMRAMETVTMYDREEGERTWADDATK